MTSNLSDRRPYYCRWMTQASPMMKASLRCTMLSARATQRSSGSWYCLVWMWMQLIVTDGKILVEVRSSVSCPAVLQWVSSTVTAPGKHRGCGVLAAFHSGWRSEHVRMQWSSHFHLGQVAFLKFSRNLRKWYTVNEHASANSRNADLSKVSPTLWNFSVFNVLMSIVCLQGELKV